MSEMFRKGQLVPKRLGIVSVHRKARHQVTFGTDVEVIGNMLRAMRPGLSVLCAPVHTYRGMNNGTRKRECLSFSIFTIDCSGHRSTIGMIVTG